MERTGFRLRDASADRRSLGGGWLARAWNSDGRLDETTDWHMLKRVLRAALDRFGLELLRKDAPGRFVDPFSELTHLGRSADRIRRGRQRRCGRSTACR